MEFKEFLNLLKKKKQTMFTLVFVVFMLTLVFSLAQTMKYTVKSRLLVVQNAYSNDAYVLSKSNEYLGALFAEIVYSSSFYDQVMSSNYNINSSYFSGNYSQQIKKWRNVVQTRTQGNTGIIEINVYHPQVNEAKKIALAVNDILINKNQAYQGGQGVKINIIDQPIASSYPNKPNLINNLIIAFFGSLILSLFYIYIFPEEKYNLYILSKRAKKAKYKLSKNIIEHYGQASYDKIEHEKREHKPVDYGDYEPRSEEKQSHQQANQENYSINNEAERFNNNYRTLNGDINNIIRK